MIGALLGSIGGQAIGGIANYLVNRKTKPKDFASTDYGKYLKGVSEKGAISGTERANLLGNTAQSAYGQAGMADTRLQGNLINSGMENSIAGNRARNEIRVNAANQVSEATKDIDMANEETKRSAMEQYQQGIFRRQQEQQQHDANMWGGVANTVGGMAQAGLNYGMNQWDNRTNANMLQGVIDSMGDDFNLETPENKIKLLQQIMKGGGDANQFFNLYDMFTKK